MNAPPAASVDLSVVPPSADPRAWDAFVDAHPKGCIFHTAAFADVIRATHRHESHAGAAVDASGEIVALIAPVRVATVGGLAGSWASRSIHYAEPICLPGPAGQAALGRLLTGHDATQGKRTLFAEVRNIDNAADERAALEACGYEYRDYLNYVVAITPDTETLWRKLGKSARNKINRSQRRGVEVELDTTPLGVERMYPLVQLSYARSRVPLAPIELFQNALDKLPEGAVQVRIATYQGRDVAAGISLLHGGRFYAWYGGSQRPDGVVPFDCLTWDEIRWCSENHQKWYDFGGAGWPDEPYGPREFKAKFGGDLLHLGRYRKEYAPIRIAIAKKAYQLMRGALSK